MKKWNSVDPSTRDIMQIMRIITPVLKLIHSTGADDRGWGWVCAGITLPGSTSQCGAAAGAGPWIYYHHHHTRGGKSVQKPFISTYFRVILMQVVNWMFFPLYFCASDRKQCEEKSKMVIIVWLETMWVGCREAGTDRATNENCHSPHSDHGRPQYIWNI